MLSLLGQGLAPLYIPREGYEIVEWQQEDRQFIGKYWSQGMGRQILVIVGHRSLGISPELKGWVHKVIGTDYLEGIVLVDEDKSLEDFFIFDNDK